MFTRTNPITAIFFLFIMMLIPPGCSDDSELKSEKILGYWKAIRISEVTKNGEHANTYQQRFYARFLDNNCGYLYDVNENLTNEIKWALHENNQTDVLFISTSLNFSNGGGTSDFSINTLNTIEKLQGDELHTYLSQIDTVNQDIFVKIHRTYYTRQ